MGAESAEEGSVRAGVAADKEIGEYKAAAKARKGREKQQAGVAQARADTAGAEDPDISTVNPVSGMDRAGERADVVMDVATATMEDEAADSRLLQEETWREADVQEAGEADGEEAAAAAAAVAGEAAGAGEKKEDEGDEQEQQGLPQQSQPQRAPRVAAVSIDSDLIAELERVRQRQSDLLSRYSAITKFSSPAAKAGFNFRLARAGLQADDSFDSADDMRVPAGAKPAAVPTGLAIDDRSQLLCALQRNQ